MLLWQTWQMSRQLRTRPSELIGLTDVYQAWCFDEAVVEFGTEVTAAVEEAARTAKGSDAIKRGVADNALRQMLGLPRKYRDIAQLRPKAPRPDEV